MKKILVANRGEIAIRVFRTARELGIATVAVYSDADAHAMHARFADEAVAIGEAAPSASYLDAEKVIAAARETGADAIHPGYGFLSERADFSEACATAGIIFIGPPAGAMRQLGDKISAKSLAEQSGVPVTPGLFSAGATDQELKEASRRIGFPVMLKASAGGGGRGMRAVMEDAAFDNELSSARDEAIKAFGDGSMMVEKLIQKPRHIEVQLMADQHGEVAALFERECSIQRRHQKIIEEAPSPVMTDALWFAMREASIRLAKCAGYVGAGTVEFMVDDTTGDFYFLEVNARLQVEHPVTEAITGLDLVALQIAVAEGAHLRDHISAPILAGERTAIRGHAIEARVVAENPAKGFLPGTGKIVGWAAPAGPGIRVDSGVGLGNDVSRFYDSMIAKVIAHAPHRAAATARLAHALQDFHVLGVPSNIPYLIRLLADADFATASFDTGFLGRRPDLAEFPTELPHELAALMALAKSGAQDSTGTATTVPGAWDLQDTWRSTGPA